MDTRAIAFFDSGLGGLSIARAAKALLPGERFLYAGDCANAPYGDKAPEFILDRVTAFARFLFEKENAKALVIACNTATAEAADALRARFPNEIIIGVEPAIKPAATFSKTRKIGMISTTRTATSRRYAQLIDHYAKDVEVISKGCPGLMECVEAGDLDTPATKALLHTYLDDMLEAGIDALVLGCTHYPFLAPTIESITGPAVKLFTPDTAVARQIKRVLAQKEMLSEVKESQPDVFFIAGDNEKRREITRRLYTYPATFAELTL